MRYEVLYDNRSEETFFEACGREASLFGMLEDLRQRQNVKDSHAIAYGRKDTQM